MNQTTPQARSSQLLADAWLGCIERAFPGQSGVRPAGARDPFRDPVGSTARSSLRIVADELLGGFNHSRVRPALEAIVRLRAVRDISPDVAVAMFGLARDAANSALSGGDGDPDGRVGLERVGPRVAELERLAADMFVRCRSDIKSIAERASRRRLYVADRMNAIATSSRTSSERGVPVRGGTEIP